MDQKNNEAFLKFLDKIQNQNKADLALQALQTKYEREISGEDNDKREKQLERVAELLENVEKAITGVGIKFDFQTVVNALENQTQVLQKSLEEQSILRKLSEGSLEYDKESAQYRNTSGRELTSDVSGKVVKKGGYVDFETAANRLQGQGKRVRESEANQIKFKPLEMGIKVPQQKQLPANIEPKKEEAPSFGNLADLGQGIKDRITGIFDFLSKDVKERGLFGKKPEEIEKKKEDTKPLPSVTGLNPEADNLQSSQEIMADAAKADVTLTKENNNILQQQLTELKKISEALAPKAPSELPAQDKLKPTPGSAQAQEGEGGLGLGDALAGLADTGALAKKAGGVIVKGAKAVGKGALSLGSGVAKFAASGAGKALGATAAVGLGAYTAYKGYTGAEDEKQKEIESIDAKVKAGELTAEQALVQKKEVAAQTTENKGGAIGKGTGMAAGAIGGGIAGAKVGATIGTFLGGPVGTAIGAGIGTIAGGAIGAFSGSSVGQNIGGAIGKGVANVKSFFGAEDIGKKTEEAVSGGTTNTEIQFSEMAFAKADPGNYKKFIEFKNQKTEEIYKQEIEKRKLSKDAPPQILETLQKVAASKAKIEAIKKFQKEIEAAGAGSITTKTESKDKNQQLVTGTATGTIERSKSEASAPGKAAGAAMGATLPAAEAKQRTKAIEQYQSGKQAETTATAKLKEFEKTNPFDYREKPTRTQEFLELPGTGKFSDPKKQAEYDALVKQREEATDAKNKAQEQYQKIDKTQKNSELPSGRIQTNISAPFKKLEALTSRFGYNKDQFLSSDGKTYDMGVINKTYDKEMQKELNAPVDKTKTSTNVRPIESKQTQDVANTEPKSFGAKVKDFFGFNKKNEQGTTPAVSSPATTPSVDLGERKQRAEFARQNALEDGASPEEADEIAAKMIKYGSVISAGQGRGNVIQPPPLSPVTQSPSKNNTGLQIARTSTENTDLARDANKTVPMSTPIVSNSVNNNNTTSYVPIKPTPRPERTGSALDRYNDRVAYF